MLVAVHHVTGDTRRDGLSLAGRHRSCMGLQLSGDSDGAAGIRSSEESLEASCVCVPGRLEPDAWLQECRDGRAFCADTPT